MTGCFTPQQQAENYQIMQGIYQQQQVDQANQAAYQDQQQQALEYQQRQQLIELQRRQLQQESQPQTYTVRDQYGNLQTYTVKQKPHGFGKP